MVFIFLAYFTLYNGLQFICSILGALLATQSSFNFVKDLIVFSKKPFHIF